MNLLNLLTRARASAQRREIDTTARYRDLVRQAAHGAELDPEEVVSLLTEWKRDLDQFGADVEAYGKRLDLKAQVDAGPGVTKQRQAAEAQVQTLDAKFNRVREKYLADRAPLEAEVASCEAQERAAHNALQQLTHECPYPEVRAKAEGARNRLAEAKADLQRAEARVTDINDVRLPRLRERADYYRRLASMEVNESHKADCQKTHKVEADAVKALEAELVERAQEIVEIRGRIADAEAEVAAAERELAVP